MSEEELRKHRCCFTGHRPEKLHLTEDKIKVLLSAAIKQAIHDGYERANLNVKMVYIVIVGVHVTEKDITYMPEHLMNCVVKRLN